MSQELNIEALDPRPTVEVVIERAGPHMLGPEGIEEPTFAHVELRLSQLYRYVPLDQPALIPNHIEEAVKEMKDSLNNMLYANAIKLFQELRREISTQTLNSASYVRIFGIFIELEGALQLNAKLNIIQK